MVLKIIYFPNNEFMQASLGSRASWGWVSLLNGRDVLKKEGVWSLGDGRTIRQFLDPCVPMRDDFRVRPILGRQPHEEGRVADWINHQENTWRGQLVSEVVQAEDVAAILNMMIPISNRREVLRWPHTRNG